MKPRWRRLVLIMVTAILVVVLIAGGFAVWFYKSGRLASLSQELLQRLSQQDVTFEAIEFAAWDTVVLTQVRLQQHLSDWQMHLETPRLDVHYGLAGLLNKQIDSLRLHQPHIELTSGVAPSGQPASPSAPPARPLGMLPLNRLMVQQGTMQVRWHETRYILSQLDASIRQGRDGRLHVRGSGKLDDKSATLQATAEITSMTSDPAGTLHLTAKAVPLELLASVSASGLSFVWHGDRGTFDMEAKLDLQEKKLRGTLTADMKQVVARMEGLSLQDARLSTDVTMTADMTQQTLNLKGQVSLQAKRVEHPPDVGVADLSLTTPLRLAYTSGGWHVSGTPVLRGKTVAVGSQLQMTQLSLTAPLEAQSTPGGPRFQGTAEVQAAAVRIRSNGSASGVLRIAELRGQLPIRGDTTTVEVSNARIETQDWHWQEAEEMQILPALILLGSSVLDLKQQRLVLQQIDATSPHMGSLRGRGVWQWPSRTVHDIQVQFDQPDVDALWRRVQRFIPSGIRPWQVAGHTTVDVRATRLALRSPPHLEGLTLIWDVRDGAFSHPDSTYAGEHVNGTLHATAALDAASGRYTLQGTLTLQPFALLIGSMFPAIEKNRITSVVTFSGTYSAGTEHLPVYLAGQFRNLGLLTVQGTVLQPFGVPEYDLRLHLHNMAVGGFWKTFMSDATRFPMLSQAQAQGTLSTSLHLGGRPTRLTMEGAVELADVHLQTVAMALRGVSLTLPVQLQYPLPETVPVGSPEAYGRLRIDVLRIGNAQIENASTKLALRSDSLFFQDGVQVDLLGGHIALEQITAQHLLRPQRRLQLEARLRNLDLQQLPRGTAKLPLAGVLNGDFERVLVQGDRLETQGSLTLQIAGGRIRVDSLQGHNLFSSIPTLKCSLATTQPLSLLQLTDLYPIGGMGGTIRFAVDDLTVTAGHPAAFSLKFAVQEKDGEKREITLRALNNLLFTTGSAKVASGLLGESYGLPYKRFGASATLRNDVLQLRGAYHDAKGLEYFMQAPALGGGVAIVNRVPENGILFQDFLKRLKATVLEKPSVRIQ